VVDQTHTILGRDTTDYKVIKKEASKAIDDAFKAYLDKNMDTTHAKPYSCEQFSATQHNLPVTSVKTPSTK
jgi:hypothetical protein